MKNIGSSNFISIHLLRFIVSHKFVVWFIQIYFWAQLWCFRPICRFKLNLPANRCPQTSHTILGLTIFPFFWLRSCCRFFVFLINLMQSSSFGSNSSLWWLKWWAVKLAIFVYFLPHSRHLKMAIFSLWKFLTCANMFFLQLNTREQWGHENYNGEKKKAGKIGFSGFKYPWKSMKICENPWKSKNIHHRLI